MMSERWYRHGGQTVEARAAAVLASLPLSAAERQFAVAVGERLVDLAIDAHWHAGQAGQRHADGAVPAAVAYALALLDEPDSGGMVDTGVDA